MFYVCDSKLLPCLTKQDTDSTKMVVTKVKDVFTKATTLKEFRYGDSLEMIEMLYVNNEFECFIRGSKHEKTV